MVSLDIKKETSSPISPLNTAPPEQKEGVLSFASLLKGTQTVDDKTIQNGPLVLAFGDEKASLSKEDVLALENLELNPKISLGMSSEDLKVLVKQAKQFLKDKIVQSEGFTKTEIDALPKTLNGLVQVAKKIGIDISKITLEEVKTKTPTDVKATPLFKAQNAMPEITTQQIVDTKVNTLTIDKTPKQKADDTLKLLLRGEKITKNESGLTADFSVATAKVMVAPPNTSRETEKSLASLLQNDKSEDGAVQAKTDAFQVAKADSFEVKLNEAKQMVKYLSHDVKSAIEDYKSPFTRVKVQLNPQKLGEIDLTIVQRGKNLHINLSSNNTAINTLAMNAQDLKVQLQNNGIQNASLNFNSNAQSENSQAGQQEQHRQQQQQANDEYKYFETQESNEEILNSLEIIVPNYA